MFSIDNINHSVYELADYIEFQAIIRGTCAINDLRSTLSASDDELNIDGIEEGDDNVLNKLQEALSRCAWRNVEFSGYPYIIKEGSISYLSSLNYKNQIYLFLLLANRMDMQKESIQGGKNATELFEHLCCFVAKNYFGEHSESLILGTAARGNFTQKVETILRKLNLQGTFKHPFGGTGRYKDGGIDVVSWIPFKDNKDSQLIALGQCKTGTNWEVLMKKIDFFGLFSTHQPFVSPIYMFYVAEDFGVEKWEERSSRCGVLFDRRRILDFLPQEIDSKFSMLMEDINEWVSSTIDYIKSFSRY